MDVRSNPPKTDLRDLKYSINRGCGQRLEMSIFIATHRILRGATVYGVSCVLPVNYLDHRLQMVQDPICLVGKSLLLVAFARNAAWRRAPQMSYLFNMTCNTTSIVAYLTINILRSACIAACRSQLVRYNSFACNAVLAPAPYVVRPVLLSDPRQLCAQHVARPTQRRLHVLYRSDPRRISCITFVPIVFLHYLCLIHRPLPQHIRFDRCESHPTGAGHRVYSGADKATAARAPREALDVGVRQQVVREVDARDADRRAGRSDRSLHNHLPVRMLSHIDQSLVPPAEPTPEPLTK